MWREKKFSGEQNSICFTFVLECQTLRLKRSNTVAIKREDEKVSRSIYNSRPRLLSKSGKNVPNQIVPLVC